MNINQYRKEHQKHIARIAELEKQVASADTEKTEAVAEVIRECEGKVALNNAVAIAQTDASHRILKEANDRVAQLEHALGVKTGDFKDLFDEHERATILLAEAAVKIVGLEEMLSLEEPKRKLLEEKVEELSALLSRVEDRMRRREVEEKQAILNRKALTMQPLSAAPRIRLVRKT